MVKTSITVWNIVQICLNIGGFLVFMGFFGLGQKVGTKSGLLLLFAQFGCIGLCVFGIMLNSGSQTINSSQRRQSDPNIFMYGLYFVVSLVAEGMVFYWIVILSQPNAMLMLANKMKGLLVLFLMLHFIFMVTYVFVTFMTLNYISGYPNGWGKEEEDKQNKYVEVKKPIEEGKQIPIYIIQ